MNFLKGKRTILFNVAAFAVAVLQHYGGPLPEVDPAQFAALIAVVNFGLRFVTNTAAFSKE